MFTARVRSAMQTVQAHIHAELCTQKEYVHKDISLAKLSIP